MTDRRTEPSRSLVPFYNPSWQTSQIISGMISHCRDQGSITGGTACKIRGGQFSTRKGFSRNFFRSSPVSENRNCRQENGHFQRYRGKWDCEKRQSFSWHFGYCYRNEINSASISSHLLWIWAAIFPCNLCIQHNRFLALHNSAL